MPALQSDFNKTNRTSVIVSRRRQYSDLDLDFNVHPVRKSLIPLTDIDAVKQSVKNLILTNFFERPFSPRIGSNLRDLLFEPADEFTALSLKKAIVDVIHEYEPRVDNIQVSIFDRPDNNAYAVTVAFRVITLSTQAEIALEIVRLR